MALPPAAPERQLKHRRSIDVHVYARGNGLWEVDAEIRDLKTRDAKLAGGLRKAGDPIHDMLLRLVVDEQLNIVEAGSETRWMPYPGLCNDHGDAYAAGGSLPRRLMTWFWGNGVALNDTNNPDAGLRWTPAGQGAGYELTPQLQPFANVRDYVSILSGFQVGAANPGRRGHHDGCAMFAGHPFIELPPGGANYASKFGGPTIDQVAAASIGSETFLPSVQLAVSKRIIGGEGPTLQYLSHKGPDEPLPQTFDPREAWNNMFGSFTVPDDPAKPLRIASLDTVKADVERLKMRVGAADRQRLDAHLSSVEQIRSQIDALAPLCDIPEMTQQSNDDIEGQEQLEAVNKAMCDLIVMAFACDVTDRDHLTVAGSEEAEAVRIAKPVGKDFVATWNPDEGVARRDPVAEAGR